jgi:peptide deformylase
MQKNTTIRHESEDIIQKGHPTLASIALPVLDNEFNTPKLLAIIEKMKINMLAEEDGIAIAAPQINVNKRIFVIHDNAYHQNTKNRQYVFINPKIIKMGKEREFLMEGCLSVRWLYGEVERATQVMIESQDETGARYVRGAGGLMAQIFQHEIDHLNGVLFDSKARNLEDIPPEKQNLK